MRIGSAPYLQLAVAISVSSLHRFNMLVSANKMSIEATPRVCIIGAGAAGLVTAKVFLEDGISDITILEKADEVGGTWRYVPSTSVMYSSLRTNLPKEVMAFHYDDPIPNNSSHDSFISHYEVQKYLEAYADKYNLRGYISFNSEVTAVTRCSEEGEEGSLQGTQGRGEERARWKISYKSGSENAVQSQEFDALVICNGHFSTPFIPTIEGMSSFKGRILHSARYDHPQEYVNSRVLVVGGKSSGTDLAREISFHAKEVIVSDRSHVGMSQVYGNIVLYSDILRITADGDVLFVTGETAKSIDTIVFCTGFLYECPFLSSSPELQHLAGPTKALRPLYQQLFATPYSNVALLGLPFSVIPFPLFYFMACFVSSVLRRKVSLPTAESQLEWVNALETRLKAQNLFPDKYHYLGMTQFDYMRSYASQAGVDTMKTLSYIRMLEEIYTDNSRYKPSYPGAPDNYRSRQYLCDIKGYYYTLQF